MKKSEAFGKAAGKASEESVLQTLNRDAMPDLQRISALGLAYIGDTVFDLLVRTMLLSEANEPVNKLNKKATALVNAESQSRMVEALQPHFTEEEAAVYRRGRNAKSATHAKNASIQDYRRATGLEAVFGYLYLSGRIERVEELFALARAASLNHRTTAHSPESSTNG